MATAVRNDQTNPLSTAPSAEPQPNMGDRTVINSPDKIKTLCQECRAEQGKVNACYKKRNWMDIAAIVVGVVMIALSLVAALTLPIGLALALSLSLAFVGIFVISVGLSDSPRIVPDHFEQAAFALEMQNKDGFLQFAETQKIDLKIENVLKAHRLYKNVVCLQQERKSTERYLQQLDLRLNELRGG